MMFLYLSFRQSKDLMRFLSYVNTAWLVLNMEY